VIRADDGVLCLRLPPAEACARIERAFDRDGPDAHERLGRREVVTIGDATFALRLRAPRAAMQYVLHGHIGDDPHGARITLERRLRGGMFGAAIVVMLAIVLSVALFAAMLWLGQGGLIEWLGLLFLPWVLFVLAHGAYGRIAAARRESDALRERLTIVFDDVLVAGDAGPYR
jgi:hypothetical protein